MSRDPELLVRRIRSALQAWDYDTAITLSEIHFRANLSLESRQLLAESLIRSRNYVRARAILAGLTDPTSRYYGAYASLHTEDYSAGLDMLKDIGDWDVHELQVDLWAAWVLRGRLER